MIVSFEKLIILKWHYQISFLKNKNSNECFHFLLLKMPFILSSNEAVKSEIDL